MAVTPAFTSVPAIAVPGALVPGRPFIPSSSFVFLAGGAVTITPAGPLAAAAGISAAGPLAAAVTITITVP